MWSSDAIFNLLFIKRRLAKQTFGVPIVEMYVSGMPCVALTLLCGCVCEFAHSRSMNVYQTSALAMFLFQLPQLYAICLYICVISNDFLKSFF
jgi:hypothetical protein